MDNVLLVLVLTTPLVLVPLAYFYIRDPQRTKEWIFNTGRRSKGIWMGIILALVFATLFGFLSGCSSLERSTADGRWFQDRYAYAGVDYVKKVSPQCKSGDGDLSDNLTSNLRIGADIWENSTESVEFVTEYTHHSCAFNPDRNGYDGFGMGVRINW